VNIKVRHKCDWFQAERNVINDVVPICADICKFPRKHQSQFGLSISCSAIVININDGWMLYMFMSKRAEQDNFPAFPSENPYYQDFPPLIKMWLITLFQLTYSSKLRLIWNLGECERTIISRRTHYLYISVFGTDLTWCIRLNSSWSDFRKLQGNEANYFESIRILILIE